MATEAEPTQYSKPARRAQGFLLKSRVDGAHPQTDYYLLPEDLLVRNGDGSYSKVGPGLAVGGFILTPEQEAELAPVEYIFRGLDYQTFEPTEGN